MELIEKVKSVLARQLRSGERIGVAVSGGIDSMCLTDCLLRFGLLERERLTVIHAEHGIRGEESLRDASFVADYCAAHGLRLLSESADVPHDAKANGRSVETEARLFRRRLYGRAVREGVASSVLTAHHKEDNTETVLMHIFRGCGLQGLVGMTERDGFLVRPLLGCTKAEIASYAEAYGVPHVEDSTNKDDAYARNALRLNVLPELRRQYAGLDDALADLSAIAKDALNRECYGITSDGESVLLPLRPTGDAVLAAFRAAGLTADYEKKHVEATVGLASRATGTGTDLPHGFRAEREADAVRIYRRKETEAWELSFDLGAFRIGGREIVVATAAEFDVKKETALDADRLPEGTVIRPRRSGDVFRPFGGGTKLLSDWLTDKKIPRYERERSVCVARGNEVFAVVGICTGERVKITEQTKNAVTVTVREENL